jgi:hypothetical protein
MIPSGKRNGDPKITGTAISTLVWNSLKPRLRWIPELTSDNNDHAANDTANANVPSVRASVAPLRSVAAAPLRGFVVETIL